jgi:uncharacterized protein (DUF1499 family)
MAPHGLGGCPGRAGRPPDCVSTADASGDPRRRLTPLPVAAADAEVVTAVLGVVGRLPGGRVLERDARRVRARAVSRLLRIRTEVTVVVEAGAVHVRLAGPRGLLDPRTLRARGRDVLAAVDAGLRGRPAPASRWLRR